MKDTVASRELRSCSNATAIIHGQRVRLVKMAHNQIWMQFDYVSGLETCDLESCRAPPCSTYCALLFKPIMKKSVLKRGGRKSWYEVLKKLLDCIRTYKKAEKAC